MAFGITSETFKVYIYVKIVFWTDLFIYRTFAITHLECNLQELISCSKMFRFNTDFFPSQFILSKIVLKFYSSVCPSLVDPVNIVSVEGIIGLIGGARSWKLREMFGYCGRCNHILFVVVYVSPGSFLFEMVKKFWNVISRILFLWLKSRLESLNVKFNLQCYAIFV